MTTTDAANAELSAPLELSLPGFPEHLTFLEDTAERTLVEVHLEPGGGTPLHVHADYAETFDVLDGAVDVELAGRTTRLGPGDQVTAPARVPHRFTNATDAPTRFRVSIEPGQRGFVEMQLVFFGLRTEGLADAEGNPTDPRHAAVALGWGGAAPATTGDAFAMRVFRLIARLTGEERRLRARYVTPAQLADRMPRS